MALNNIPQIDELDAKLDALVAPTGLDVYEASLPYDSQTALAALGHRVLNSDGGAGGGFYVVKKAISWDDPLILDGILITIPVIGDVLYRDLCTFVVTEPFSAETTFYVVHVDDVVPTWTPSPDVIGATIGTGGVKLVENGEGISVSIDDGNGGDPGNTQGQAWVALTFLAAP